VFDVVLATMAMDHLDGCGLADGWKQMFSEKSIQIKSIQQSLECCGFASTKDRAYPFPGKDTTATACVEKYGYSQPCAPLLENANYRAAMTFFVVLLVAILTKVSLSVRH